VNDADLQEVHIFPVAVFLVSS